MRLVNCKIRLELNRTKNFVMYGNDVYAATVNDNKETSFKITNTKLFVPIVTLSAKDNVKLTKQLSVYWNQYTLQNIP